MVVVVIITKTVTIVEVFVVVVFCLLWCGEGSLKLTMELCTRRSPGHGEEKQASKEQH